MDIKLFELAQDDIQKAVSIDSKRYAAKSIHCAHGLLSAALGVYLSDFHLKTNLPQKVISDMVVPENADVQRMLDRVRGTRMEGAILLGACCGLRRSEICGLKYSDIDVEKSQIKVRRTIVKDEHGKWIVRDNTKTPKSKREFEVAPFIIQRLLELPCEGEFVINRMPDTISKEFIDLRNELGLTCRFHDLRHYNASIMLALNIPDKYAMERGGWSTTDTLKAVYQHTFSDERKHVDELIDGFFDDVLRG